MINQELSPLASNIRTLSTMHYILACLTGLAALFPGLYVAMGVMFVSGTFNSPPSSSEQPPEAIGWLFIVIGSIGVLIGLAIAVSMFLAGRRLAERRSLTFCLVVAGIECIFMPLGTILGIFTIIALTKPEAKGMFAD